MVSARARPHRVHAERYHLLGHTIESLIFGETINAISLAMQMIKLFFMFYKQQHHNTRGNAKGKATDIQQGKRKTFSQASPCGEEIIF